MIGDALAQRLADAGLHWRPAPGDHFRLLAAELDDEVFILSDMVSKPCRQPICRRVASRGTEPHDLDVSGHLSSRQYASYGLSEHGMLRKLHITNGITVAPEDEEVPASAPTASTVRPRVARQQPAGEPLLGFGTRALVHFAVSNDEVWMTTKLAGAATRFLPFNRGDDGHAGNPLDEAGGSRTTYLWRHVLQRDSWLDILGRFVHYEAEKVKDDHGRAVRRHNLIFPRFHQLDVVTGTVADAQVNGPGHNYLVQHSAGSGKTRSIAWTAHRLATLHDETDDKVFDTVIVVTDCPGRPAAGGY